MRVAVKIHALPVYKKNKIELLCIFEATIIVLCFVVLYFMSILVFQLY